VAASSKIEGKMLLKAQQELCLSEDCRIWPLFSKNLFPPLTLWETSTQRALLQKAAKLRVIHNSPSCVISGMDTQALLGNIKNLKRTIKTVFCMDVRNRVIFRSWFVSRCHTPALSAQEYVPASILRYAVYSRQLGEWQKEVYCTGHLFP